MEQNEFISVNDFCQYHKIEMTFIQSLEESDLIQISVIGEDEFIPYDEIPRIEKFIRMHYDLDINVAGLETIDYLLRKVEALQSQINHIHNQIHDTDFS